MKKLTIFLGAIAMIATTPAPAQIRGDEPVAVPRAVRQGIDFVYVDPQMSSVARKRQRPQNWLARMFSGDGGGRQGAPNPMFVDLARGLQQYQANWGALPQAKIPAGAALKRGSAASVSPCFVPGSGWLRAAAMTSNCYNAWPPTSRFTASARATESPARRRSRR